MSGTYARVEFELPPPIGVIDSGTQEGLGAMQEKIGRASVPGGVPGYGMPELSRMEVARREYALAQRRLHEAQLELNRANGDVVAAERKIREAHGA